MKNVKIIPVKDCKKVKRDKDGMRFKDGFPYFNVSDEHIQLDLSDGVNKTISIKLPDGKSIAISIMSNDIMIPTICDITAYKDEKQSESKLYGVLKTEKNKTLGKCDIYSLEVL